MGAVLRFLVSIAVPLLVGGLAGMATARGVREWYPSLVKPAFNPPAWIFAPVWTVLYIMMGIATFLVWQRGWNDSAVRIALGIFLVQLILNGLWSILFFGMHSPGVALVEIIFLWLAILLTIFWYWRVTTAAGVLLLPYAAWVTFAAVLNGSLWMLNR